MQLKAIVIRGYSVRLDGDTYRVSRFGRILGYVASVHAADVLIQLHLDRIRGHLRTTR